MSDTTSRSVEPLAWDARGRRYSFWADKRGVSLARSSDPGETWTTWRVLDLPHASFFHTSPRAAKATSPRRVHHINESQLRPVVARRADRCDA
jgi:hypothetical protein